MISVGSRISKRYSALEKAMSQLTFQLDKSSEEALEELKGLLGTKSSAAAVRTALALANIVMSTQEKGRVVVRDTRSGNDLSIVLAG